MMQNIPDHKSGDWWEGITQASVKLQGSPLDLTGAEITITAKKHNSSDISWSRGTVSGGIRITSPLQGQFVVDGCAITLPPGTYIVVIVCTTADGKPRTIFEAKWNIVEHWGV